MTGRRPFFFVSLLSSLSLLTSRVGTAGATDTSRRRMLGSSWSPGGAGGGIFGICVWVSKRKGARAQNGE